MIRCIIIEDQVPAQRILMHYLDQTPSIELLETFSNPIEAKTYLQTANHTIDLIFLDIHLPHLSGIELLKTLTSQPMVILTTAFSDYGVESYEFNVIDYLLKPFSFERFSKAVHKAIRAHQNNIAEHPTIILKSGHEQFSIEIDRILYIKSELDYTEVHTLTKKYLSQHTLKYWLEKLSDRSFVQLHKSYIVHLKHIRKQSGNQVVLSNAHSLPIGRVFKSAFIKAFIR